MRRFGHDRLKTFGVGQELSARQWRSVFRQLIALGYLSVEMDRRAGFVLTEKSRPVLRGEETVQLREDPAAPRRSRRKPKSAGMIEDTPAAGLWEHLRTLRREIAQQHEVPAYVIFHDKTLKEMAFLRPTTREALLAVSGVGETKADRYGDQFIAAIVEWEARAS